MGLLNPYHNRALYLDSNIFIYMLEGVETYPRVADFMLNEAKNASAIITSTLTLTELLVPLYTHHKSARLKKYLRFVSGHGDVSVISVNRSIAIQAAQLRSQFSLNTPDAIHLATAFLCRADYFITADKAFSKVVTGSTKIHII